MFVIPMRVEELDEEQRRMEGKNAIQLFDALLFLKAKSSYSITTSHNCTLHPLIVTDD